jgi:predicted NBD/HSP70 family sugar kinase
MWSLFAGQPCSRQDLSDATGLSFTSICKAIRELIDEGVVTEASPAGSGGRTRVLLRMNPGHGHVVGIDVGETRARIAMFDLAMTVRARADVPLDPGVDGVGTLVERVSAGLSRVLAGADVDPGDVLGAGVAVPGVVERGREVLVYGQTYGWDAVPLERLLRSAADFPVYIDNDAKAMGQAELWFGAGRGARHAVVCLIGSGVGASVITAAGRGRGDSSASIEWGHTAISTAGRSCRCGSRGCLEAYVGAGAILGRYGLPLAGEDEESALASLVGTASDRAAGVLQETAVCLGAGIANLINLFSPERVILGGWAGLLLGERLLPAIREAARDHSLAHRFAQATIELGRLGADAVTLGAAALPMEHLLNGALATRPPAADDRAAR